MPVHVVGLQAALAALDPEKVPAARDAALAELAAELATPKGSGLGVVNNNLMAAAATGLAAVESTLIWPRTTGQTWVARTLQDAEAYGDAILAAQGEQLAVELDG